MSFEITLKSKKGRPSQSCFDYISIITSKWIKENDSYQHSSKSETKKFHSIISNAKEYSSLIAKAIEPTTKFNRREGKRLMKEYPCLCSEKIEYYKALDQQCPGRLKMLPKAWELLDFNPDARFD